MKRKECHTCKKVFCDACFWFEDYPDCTEISYDEIVASYKFNELSSSCITKSNPTLTTNIIDNSTDGSFILKKDNQYLRVFNEDIKEIDFVNKCIRLSTVRLK